MCARTIASSCYTHLPTGRDPPDSPYTLLYKHSQELLHLPRKRASDPDHGILGHLIETYRGSIKAVQPVEEIDQHPQCLRLVSLYDVA